MSARSTAFSARNTVGIRLKRRCRVALFVAFAMGVVLLVGLDVRWSAAAAQDDQQQAANRQDAQGQAKEQQPPAEVSADHAAQMQQSLALFKSDVRDILTKHCLPCHGGEKTEAEFDLATREGLLKGGYSGPAVKPGHAEESLLYRLVAHQAEPPMPYEEDKMADDAIATLATWLNTGAAYDGNLLTKDESLAWTRTLVDPAARQHWAFAPLTHSAPPPVKNTAWVRNPVDQFILAAQEAAGVTPAGSASRRQLMRRLSFDLTGLPPDPVAVERFVNDPRPDAYARLVDELLANPGFGERWARHWLDLARFGESHGFEHDYDRPTAYHYRDFVIEALNRDMPYDQFVSWQLAGDELAPDDLLAWMATGYLASGVHSTQITKNEVEKQRYDELDDIVGNIGTTMLGLATGCARCHDHKFDPIPQRDYYEMIAVFRTAVRAEIERPLPDAWYATRPESAPSQGTIKLLVTSEGLPAIRLHTQGDDFFPESYYLRRGDVEQKDGQAEAGYLQVLMNVPSLQQNVLQRDALQHNSAGGSCTATEPGDAKRLAADVWKLSPPPDSKTSFRRSAFAAWLTDHEHGAGHLLARVIVNRLWQHYLGRGIVATPSDFGLRGEPPTNPELLDWLASELIRHNWQLKPIHRLILMSATYRQEAEFSASNDRLDHDNRLFWRPARGRLEAEVIRDAMLAVAGEENARMLGPGTMRNEDRRRSIYFTVKRSQLTPVLQAFDAPDALGGIGARATTTVAPQALHLMNNDEVRACARSFAQRLMKTEPAGSAADPLAARIALAYQLAFSRPATAEEIAAAGEFLTDQAGTYAASGTADPEVAALIDFCQALFCANEFVYLD